jgi:hypothetical protein
MFIEGTDLPVLQNVSCKSGRQIALKLTTNAEFKNLYIQCTMFFLVIK